MEQFTGQVVISQYKRGSKCEVTLEKENQCMSGIAGTMIDASKGGVNTKRRNEEKGKERNIQFTGKSGTVTICCVDSKNDVQWFLKS